jgi:hypothetical protein
LDAQLVIAYGQILIWLSCRFARAERRCTMFVTAARSLFFQMTLDIEKAAATANVAAAYTHRQ